MFILQSKISLHQFGKKNSLNRPLTTFKYVQSNSFFCVVSLFLCVIRMNCSRFSQKSLKNLLASVKFLTTCNHHIIYVKYKTTLDHKISVATKITTTKKTGFDVKIVKCEFEPIFKLLRLRMYTMR